MRVLRRRPTRGDDGMTLVELVVAMSIFTVVVVLFLSAVTSLSRTAVRTQNEADAAADLRRVYQQMDRQVRYADAVNYPGDVGERTYVELRTTATTELEPYCHQWRITPSTGAVELRSWPEAQAPGPTWKTLATTVVGPSGPFELLPADVASSRVRQALRVSLVAARGSGATRAEAETSTLFVARNSSQSSPGNARASVADPPSSASPVCGALSTTRPMGATG